MRELAKKGGTIESLLVRAGVSIEDMEQAIDRLRRHQYLEVIGPPAQNSDLGKDVDVLRLLPYGVGYLRTLHR